MTKAGDRRTAFRMNVVSNATCRLVAEGEVISGPIRDISIAGLYVQTDERPDIGTVFEVEILLAGRSSQMRLGSMTGRVARLDEGGLAITFAERFEWFAMVPLYFHTTSGSAG